MITPDPTLARTALAQRLRAVAAVLLDHVPNEAVDPAEDAAQVLTAVVARLRDRPGDEDVWLLLSGLTTTFPTRDEVDETRRRIELSDQEQAALFLLDQGLSSIRWNGAPLAELIVVTGRVLVDVDFTARHDLHTGIQRVVRQTVPLWNLDHDIVPVAWTSARGAMRPLDPVESARIYQWSANKRTDGRDDQPDRISTVDHLLVIPWRCVVVLPEVPELDIAPRLAAIGACSNNALVAVGHDAIPLMSADTVPDDEPRKFMSYLSALKFADRIAGVSRSSTKEFAGYCSMLSSQGLPAPLTVAVPLPVEFAGAASPASSQATDSVSARREVVVVGSHDSRKNHLAVLHAAELLWREGLSFRLTFIGSGGSNVRFLRRVKVLQHRGRDVRLRTGLPDAEMRAAVANARFTVFPSLHEGYGLPVAESLALGTPAITTDYGATAEIAAGGGAVTVDPRDDAELTATMRRLLSDDAEIARLRAEIHRRPERSWQDYADELWNAIVGPVLQDLAGPRVDAGRQAAR